MTGPWFPMLECALYGLIEEDRLRPLESRLKALSMSNKQVDEVEYVYQTTSGTKSSSMARILQTADGSTYQIDSRYTDLNGSQTSIGTVNEARVSSGDAKGFLASLGYAFSHQFKVAGQEFEGFRTRLPLKFGEGVKDGEELGLAGKWLVKASIRLDDPAELALAEGTLLEVSSHQLDDLVTLAKIPLRCFNF